MKKTKNYLLGLDIFRIIAVISIFLFHARIHIKVDFGILNSFIGMGAIFMTAFFMISGFSIFYANGNMDLSNIANLKKFYLKRFLGIYPLYIVVYIVYLLILDNLSGIQNLILLPIELTLTQSSFESLFSVSHNGGTWFISCIAFCYFLFPFIAIIIKQLSKKSISIGILVISIFCMYSPIVVATFNLNNIYSNIFFRILEFTIGVLLAVILKDINMKGIDNFFGNPIVICMNFLILILIVTKGIKLDIEVGNYMMYNIIAIPMFIVLIIGFVNMKIEGKFYKIKYLNSLAYSFFLAQFFAWKLTMKLVEKFNTSNNILKLIIAFSICVVISILMNEIIEKPIKKWSIKKQEKYGSSKAKLI